LKSIVRFVGKALASYGQPHVGAKKALFPTQHLGLDSKIGFLRPMEWKNGKNKFLFVSTVLVIEINR